MKPCGSGEEQEEVSSGWSTKILVGPKSVELSSLTEETAGDDAKVRPFVLGSSKRILNGSVNRRVKVVNWFGRVLFLFNVKGSLQ